MPTKRQILLSFCSCNEVIPPPTLTKLLIDHNLVIIQYNKTILKNKIRTKLEIEFEIKSKNLQGFKLMKWLPT
jgi:hypothetical protein